LKFTTFKKKGNRFLKSSAKNPYSQRAFQSIEYMFLFKIRQAEQNLFLFNIVFMISSKYKNKMIEKVLKYYKAEIFKKLFLNLDCIPFFPSQVIILKTFTPLLKF